MAYKEDIKIGFQIKLGFDNYFKNNTKFKMVATF